MSDIYWVGDTVRCIDNDGATKQLKEGSLYIVVKVEGDYLTLRGKETSYAKSRFELFEPVGGPSAA